MMRGFWGTVWGKVALYLRFPLFLLLVFFSTSSVVAQTANVKFGQNRVQYGEFTWSYYQTDNFNVYFYIGGQDLGKYVIQTADAVAEEVSEKLDFQLDWTINIIVYNDLSDRNQTNIGIANDNQNTGGTTDLLANKLFVYFNGDHEDLRQQIKEGIARLYVQKMMTGVNFQEVLQNAVLLNLPEWFTEGLVRYIGENWNTDLDNQLRNGIMQGDYEKLNKLESDEAAFVGHAFWHWVEEFYGKSAVPNLLYLTRINRSMESGFLFVLGNSVNQAMIRFNEFYRTKYTQEAESRTLPDYEDLVDKKDKKHWDYYEVEMSPDGKHIAYATNDMGKFKVHVINKETGDHKVVLKNGWKTNTIITDLSFPLMDWDPKGQTLAIIYEKRDRLWLMQYHLNDGTKEKKEITKFQSIVSMSYADSKSLVIAGMQKAQLDIFQYYIASTKTVQITNDFWDDLNPAPVQINGYNGIMFSSNRLDDTLRSGRLDTIMPGGSFDLFFYNLDTKSDQLIRVTNTPLANERDPQNFSNDYYIFSSDESGIRNRYGGYFESVFSHFNKKYYYYDSELEMNDSITLHEKAIVDSFLDMSKVTIDSIISFEVFKDIAITFPLTNYSMNLESHDYSKRTKTMLDVIYKDGNMNFFVFRLDTIIDQTNVPVLKKTSYMEYAEREFINSMSTVSVETPVNVVKLDPPPSAIPDKPFYFQTDFDFGSVTFPVDTTSEGILVTKEIADRFKLGRVKPYAVKFSTDQLVTQLDNQLLMTGYDKFNPQDPSFTTPDLSLLFQLGITDLMEDHKIIGGFRFPVNFNSSEYFITYMNLKKRLDKSFTYYRQSNLEAYTDQVPFYGTNIPFIDAPVEASVRTNYADMQFKYPLDPIQRIGFGIAFRNDRYLFKSTSQFSLELPKYSENWIFLQAEYVYDNTIDVMLNIKNGIRFKAFAEIHKEIPAPEDTLFGSIQLPIPQITDSYFAVFGVDFRWYQKIHRQIIWANRVAWTSSVGTRKVIYYLGGIDNWIGANFDRSIPVNQDNNYAFQALATNVRGFDQNIRNGNSFFVVNSELRVPVFSYLVNSPIRSEFIKNFQIVGFADVGTAWEGVNPFSDENPLFTDQVGSSPVTVQVNYYRNPIVFGYGVGARTQLFGYFMRLDVGWGIDSGQKTEATWYFSLSKDF